MIVLITQREAIEAPRNMAILGSQLPVIIGFNYPAVAHEVPSLDKKMEPFTSFRILGSGCLVWNRGMEYEYCVWG